MTSGIDGDDDYSINPLPSISFQKKIEELQGRNVEQLDASHRFLTVVQRILFCCDQNTTLIQLIPYSKEPQSLQRGQIQQLDSAHSLRNISIPIIPKEPTSFNLYQKDVLDFTYEAEKEIAEEYAESELTLAPRQVFLEFSNREAALSLEELFAK